MNQNGREKRPPRIWLQDVETEVIALRGELKDIVAARSQEQSTSHSPTDGLIGSVWKLLETAEHAAQGRHPRRRRLLSGWNGECIEAAYRNMHRAESEIARLYDEAQADAMIPEAVARLQSSLSPGDLRCGLISGLKAAPMREKTQRLSRAIQIGHEAKDQQYAKIRRFRNIIVIASALISVFLILFAVSVSVAPNAVPLCFLPTVLPGSPARPGFCPAGSGALPSGSDVWIVLLMGLLGGALSAAVSVRNIRGAPTPYNLATALAWLKVPSGALTAVGAIILIRGQVVPGLSALESQGQVLAYALVFGYAQQLLTRLIDKRAGELVDDIPFKAKEGPPGATVGYVLTIDWDDSVQSSRRTTARSISFNGMVADRPTGV